MDSDRARLQAGSFDIVLQRTRKKCWAIRNRVYPEEVWPSSLVQKKIVSFGGRDKVLLEIGCGRDADLLRRVARHFCRAVGIDLEIVAQDEPDSNCRLLSADAHHVPIAADSVDVISCLDVVEHLADPAAWFAECARVLKPGGHLIVATVNAYFPPIVFGRLLPHWVRQKLNYLVSGTEEQDTFPVCYHANTKRSLVGLARQARLEPVSIEYVAHHPTYFLFSTVVYRLAIYCEQVVRRHERLGFMRHLIHAVFVAHSPTGGERTVA